MTAKRLSSRTARTRSAGLSLVELMVAVALSSLVLIVVVQLFVNNKATYRAQEAQARLQENGRFAVEYLARDIRRADFWGCNPQFADVTNNLQGTGGAGFVFAGGVAGTEGGASSPLPAPDAITVAGGRQRPLQLQANMTTVSDTISVPANQLEQGDIVLIADCMGGEVFQITSGDTTTQGGALEHEAPTPSGSFGNDDDALDRTYTTVASVYAVEGNVTYSINVPASGEPELRRNGQAIIESVENMQILYGEDTNNDDDADYYVSANNVTDMEEVVSVRVSLLLRTQAETNSEPVPYTFAGVNVTNPGDNRSRRVFTTTITLRNRAS